ncbi:MAG: 1,4-alpha-glucan branching protein GlgB [Acidobacteriota bacterium]
MRTPQTVAPSGVPSLLDAHDLHLFNEGRHHRLYDRLGAHPMRLDDGTEGVYFAVWAPSARNVGVIGEFNGWDPEADPLRHRDSSGIWEGFVAGARAGHVYKFHVESHLGHGVFDKADPLARAAEVPPRTASRVHDWDHPWADDDWMRERWRHNALDAPMSTYEVHLGSWRRGPRGEILTYRDVAPLLADYVAETGFTHVELLPIMEHPFYGSWGYQTTGYFAPTARFGPPDELQLLIDTLHDRGIGVILDWVPSHFPTDPHGLYEFDGTHLYEHADPRRGYHPDWTSAIFNYGRHEVRAFLTSSALFWLDRFHADGLRVDAVASMLYLDYSRRAGEWIPNPEGGRENLEAVEFLRDLNVTIYREYPDVQVIAEESTAWPGVTRPVDAGGLGFGLKWDMGWMHDTLDYLSRDPVHRRWDHDRLTFRSLYASTENFVLPLSHDEVVHGKGSLLERMPGDRWQQFANLRALLGYQYAQPGKKLLFMGCEWGQPAEWDHDRSLDWHLLEEPRHAGVQRWVTDLNRVYRREPALHQLDVGSGGFEWVEANDAQHSLYAFLRRGREGRPVLVAANLTPVPRTRRVGVPEGGRWVELLNSDAESYGGGNVGNAGGVVAEREAAQGRELSVELRLPPLGVLFLAPERSEGPADGGTA